MLSDEECRRLIEECLTWASELQTTAMAKGMQLALAYAIETDHVHWLLTNIYAFLDQKGMFCQFDGD